MLGCMTMTSNPLAGTDADGVLHKVRSLLATAESTTFPAEAEALTAKAQQLMDRHAIDRAMVAASTGRGSGPEGREVTIDAPYAREKYLLLAAVARANRSRAVFAQHDGVATVVGFPEDQAFMRDIAERKRRVLEEGIASVMGRHLAVRCVVANLELVEPVDSGEGDLVGCGRRVGGRAGVDDLVGCARCMGGRSGVGALVGCVRRAEGCHVVGAPAEVGAVVPRGIVTQ